MTTKPKFMQRETRIGIVNRGEAALRFIRAVREYNAIYETRLSTAVFHTEEESGAPFVAEADTATLFPGTGGFYLDRQLMLDALKKTECGAVWPGWGFLSEDSGFAAMLENAGIVFIGPASESMRLLGDKIAAKTLAENAGVPVLPWSRVPVKTAEEAAEWARKIGYPCIIKAANAGGGRGIRFVRKDAELAPQFNSALMETRRVTGGDIVFIERLVETVRHLEVQTIADAYGAVLTFGVRDCSVQRRNQKVIEETPPPGFPGEIAADMEKAAARLVKAAGYRGAGTVEFLYDAEGGCFYFMEVNTRLQVEHPITEQLYGIDLVHLQIRTALGERLPSSPFSPRGSVIEVRLNAEDPDRDFAPAPGRVAVCSLPSGPGIRVDSGIGPGTVIPREFDSMVAKISAAAATRAEALGKLVRAVSETRIIIENGTTNRSFLLELLRQPEIAAGGVHTRYIEDYLKRRKDPRLEWQAALAACAVDRYLANSREEMLRFKEQLVLSGSPRDIAAPGGLGIELTALGNTFHFHVKAVDSSRFHIAAAGELLPVQYSAGPSHCALEMGGRIFTVQVIPRGDSLQCEIGDIPYAIGIESKGIVKAPSLGLVISIGTEAGRSVSRGDVVVILEAMKMEILVKAPEDGVVKEIKVKTGDQVTSGQALIQLDTADTNQGKPAAVRGHAVSFHNWKTDSSVDWIIKKQELRALFMGFDHGPGMEESVKALVSLAAGDAGREQELSAFVADVMEAYAAVEQLFSSKAAVTEEFARPVSFQDMLVFFYLRSSEQKKGMSDKFLAAVDRALKLYKFEKDAGAEVYSHFLFRIYKSHAELKLKQEVLKNLLFALVDLPQPAQADRATADLLDEITLLSQLQNAALSDAAIHARYVLVDKSYLNRMRKTKSEKIERSIDLILIAGRLKRNYSQFMQIIIDSGNHVIPDLVRIADLDSPARKGAALEILGRRFNRDRVIETLSITRAGGIHVCAITGAYPQGRYYNLISVCRAEDFAGHVEALSGMFSRAETVSVSGIRPAIEVIVITAGDPAVSSRERFQAALASVPSCADLATLVQIDAAGKISYTTFTPDSSWKEDEERCFFSPLFYRELRVARLTGFMRKLLYSSSSVYVLALKSKTNPKDERLWALVDVPAPRPEFDEDTGIRRMIAFENVFNEAVFAMRAEQAKRKRRLHWNRLVIHIRTTMDTTLEQVRDYAGRMAARTRDLGLEKLVIYSRRPSPAGAGAEEVELLFENISGVNFVLRGRIPSEEPIAPMDDYVAKVVQSRSRGTVYPYEIIKMITRTGAPVSESFPKGEFEEYDIPREGEPGEFRYVSMKGRPYGLNTGNIVFGLISNIMDGRVTAVKRVIILSDTTADMGSLSEAECRRVIAALDLAEDTGLPVEWLPVSAGARIEMDSGTENLDWTASVLRRIIEFTRNGGEINIIVAGVNVGAQSYWNAEASMLLHTRGLLIMTEDASMLLTGKKALDFSGSVSADENTGIGGAEKIMEPNGQAQIKTGNLYEAYSVLFRHYSLTYADPGQVFPERLETADPPDRDAGLFPYKDSLGQGFTCVADIFSRELNPERKKPFEVRQVMRSLIDQDREYLERWQGMKDAETAVVWEARIGGFAACLLGIESRPLIRPGDVPHDGPESWSGGTLFPLASKKIARAVHAASGRLPLVMLANLSGFDGSPESLRKLQLEYGAEIGRAIVNFQGPIIFIVIARYHGGAYVVFSKALNPALHAAALEGSYASVIGGAPAAAVVFPSLVLKDTYADARIEAAREQLKTDPGFFQKDFDELFEKVHAEKQNALAQRFDNIHSVERAKQVGSIDAIISIRELRPYVIRKIEEGMKLKLTVNRY